MAEDDDRVNLIKGYIAKGSAHEADALRSPCIATAAQGAQPGIGHSYGVIVGVD